LAPWLYTIAHNAALNGLRDRQPESLEVAREVSHDQGPHDIVTRRESLRSVVRALVGLPSRQRQVILRQEFDGESHEQIARELGLTTGAVRQLAHRARCTVRAAAAALMPGPLWQRLPWLSGTSDGAELVAGSAFGAVVAKTAAAMLVAGAAGGAVELTAAQAPAPAPPAAKTAPRHAAVAEPPGRAGARPAAVRATTPATTRRAATSMRAPDGGSGRSRAQSAKRRRPAGLAASVVPPAAHATAPAQQGGGPASGTGQHAHGHGGAGADASGATGGGHGRGRGGDGGGHGHGRKSAGSHGTSGSAAVDAGAISAAPAEAEDATEVEDELTPEAEVEAEHEPGSSGVNSGSRPLAPASESNG
jgi:hypothetical protein